MSDLVPVQYPPPYGPKRRRISVGTTVSYIVLLVILLITPRGDTTLTDVEAEIGGYDDTVRAFPIYHVPPP